MDRIKDIALKLNEREVRYSQLSWVQYTAGYDFGVDQAYKEVVQILADKDAFEMIKSVLKNDLAEDDRRRVALLFRAFEPYHLSDEINDLAEKINEKTNELSNVLNLHRTNFEGREISSVDLSQILSTEENRERRKQAYFARNQVNQPLLDAGFLELVQMRKEMAKLRGKKDFVALKLEEDELDVSLFATWKEQMKTVLPKMKATRLKYAEKFLQDTAIMPWDEQYISAKLAPALNQKVDMAAYYQHLSSFFEKFGFDLTKMNITFDVFSRANKSEWGYNFPIETGKDSRILANVKDLYNEYGVLLHETGHAVHSFTTNPEDLLMNMGISGIISEGIANLFGDFLYDPLFYSNFFDVGEVSENFEAIREWQKINAFRAIHRILFDQELYQNDIRSGEDVENLYWKLYKELFEEAPFGENPPWAYSIHHTTHPIYLHNYFMGDVTCEMLAKVFTEKNGIAKVSEKPEAFGDFLMEMVITPSGRLPYLELFKHISGSEFSLEYLL